MSLQSGSSQPDPPLAIGTFPLTSLSYAYPTFFPPSETLLTAHTSEPGPNSASLARRVSLPTFPIQPLPAPFASGPSHTPFGHFPPQYLTSTNPSLFRNQPLQSQVHHGYHPSGPSQHPLPYFSPQYQLQPYSLFRSTMSGPAPPHGGPYGDSQQLPPHSYSQLGHYVPQQRQPSVSQWHYGPALAVVMADPAHVQPQYQHFMNYPAPLAQHPRGYSDTSGARSTGSERRRTPGLEHNSSSAAVTTSQHTRSSPFANPPEQVPADSSPKTQHQSTAGTSHVHDGPPIRHHHHPSSPSQRSEWVMWVGNIPNATTHDELSRFLKQPAPVSSESSSSGVEDDGVLSVFLIPRSHCAFANYESKEHLDRAISQFNGRKLRPHDRRCPRLVCRVRKREDDLRSGVGGQRGVGIHTHYVKDVLQRSNKSSTAGEGETSGPRTAPVQSPSSHGSTSSSFLIRHFPKRFFILKSLTHYDLDLSVERSVWATQKHNEGVLDQAFRTSREVILIFSVNKSREFYGYARMASGIPRSNHDVSWAPRSGSSPSTPLSPIHPVEPSLDPSSEMHTSPLERRFAEAPPLPHVRSADRTRDNPSKVASISQVRFSQERRSVPPMLDCDSEDRDAPPSSFGRGNPPDSGSHSSSATTKSGAHCGSRTGTESKGIGGPDEPGHIEQHLLPVAEENAESGIEVEQPAQVAAPSEIVHHYSEGQEREVSWGETFKIEWISATRVQFHRTRHLRNPWNHDREIKVSRDGTELEPTVGQNLIDSWLTLANEPASRDVTKRAANSSRSGAKNASKHGSQSL